MVATGVAISLIGMVVIVVIVIAGAIIAIVAVVATTAAAIATAAIVGPVGLMVVAIVVGGDVERLAGVDVVGVVEAVVLGDAVGVHPKTTPYAKEGIAILDGVVSTTTTIIRGAGGVADRQERQL
jgi:hypothetical protein